MTIASSIGADVFPVVSGQLMEDYPMTMMYLTAITIISCSFMFALAIFVAAPCDSRAVWSQSDVVVSDRRNLDELLARRDVALAEFVASPGDAPVGLDL